MSYEGMRHRRSAGEEPVNVIEWLRDACREYKLEPYAIYRKQGTHASAIKQGNDDDLARQLEERGHLLPLPREPAALANIIEVALVTYLLKRLAGVKGAVTQRGKERHYPDVEVSGPPFGGGFHAIDIKVARRAEGASRTDSRITLYTGNTYFRYPTLKWPGTFRPFNDYATHVDVFVLYTLNENAVHRVDDLQLVVQEPWRIGSKKRSSTTREYIGAVDKIDDLVHGRGDFKSKEEFYKFWRAQPFKIGKVVQQQLDKLLLAQGSAGSGSNAQPSAGKRKKK